MGGYGAPIVAAVVQGASAVSATFSAHKLWAMANWTMGNWTMSEWATGNWTMPWKL